MRSPHRMSFSSGRSGSARPANLVPTTPRAVRSAPRDLPQLENPMWGYASRDEIPQCQPITPETTPTVDPRLRPEAPARIGQHIPPHQRSGEAKRHRALADQVNGVRNLGIAEPGAGRASTLRAQMNAAQ